MREADTGVVTYPDWLAAQLPEPYLDSTGFLVLITSKTDPAKQVYAVIRSQDPRNPYDFPYIDIPIKEDISKPELVEEAYQNATFWGERDDYLLQRFATGDDKLRTLLTLLNKEISGENYDTMSRWFYETFDVQHGKNYGPVSISSSFGNKGFSVRLYPSNANKEESYLGTPIQQVIQFSQTIQQGLPQMEIKPVSMRSYLDTLHDSLQFSSR